MDVMKRASRIATPSSTKTVVEWDASIQGVDHIDVKLLSRFILGFHSKTIEDILRNEIRSFARSGEANFSEITVKTTVLI